MHTTFVLPNLARKLQRTKVSIFSSKFIVFYGILFASIPYKLIALPTFHLFNIHN